MPIYQCISPEGLLDESARGKLAEEITRIHCDATGVPPTFVNVMFLDVPDGRYFVAGRPSNHSVLNGAIRVGRDLEIRQRILRELSQMWTRLTGQTEGELLISLWENPAENVMEAGLIFPGLGQEQQWFEENRDRLTELGILLKWTPSTTAVFRYVVLVFAGSGWSLRGTGGAGASGTRSMRRFGWRLWWSGVPGDGGPRRA
jgi:phenylpyruvate tautomerase PptA (4-oxalocrotonate tautomerase family)